MSSAPDIQKPTLSREDVEEQLNLSEVEAKKNYDAYQQALGVVAACRHMLNRFDLPAKPKLEEVK